MAIDQRQVTGRKIFFIGITPLGMLPLIRYIIPLFKDQEVFIMTQHIRHSYRFDAFGIQKDIMVFANTGEFNRHTMIKKFRLYSGFLIQLLMQLPMRKPCLVYTVDYQIAAALLWIKKTINPGIKIIYHQFETVETDKAVGFNKVLQKYTLSNGGNLELAIFPEVNRMRHFSQQSNNIQGRLLVIPNTNNLPFLDRYDWKEEIRKAHDTIVIAHIGKLGSAHYTYSYFQWIRSNHQPNLKFLFIGAVEDKVQAELLQLARQDSRVQIMGELPHSELLPYYSTIDIGVILYRGIDLNHEYCAPNKLYEYWSQGIPVIAHKLAGLKSVWAADYLGKLVQMDDVESIQTGIDSIIQEIPGVRSRIRSWFENEASLDAYLPLLQEKIAAA